MRKVKEERRGYQWPAQSLTGREMEILAKARKQTGLPISELLRRAVHSMEGGKNDG